MHIFFALHDHRSNRGKIVMCIIHRAVIELNSEAATKKRFKNFLALDQPYFLKLSLSLTWILVQINFSLF